VAVLIEALTDNRNRTAADLRAAFSKNGGNLGEMGCVGWMFEHKGVCLVSNVVDEEQLLEVSLEGGAESYELTEVDEDTPGAEVICSPGDLESLSDHLKVERYRVKDIEVRWVPSNTVDVTDADQAKSLLKMMDALEDLDDVQSVTANFDMGEEILTAAL
jgi:YebC/PmpR family DNA-binding regulatory protein